jgi:hypothetical protein
LRGVLREAGGDENKNDEDRRAAHTKILSGWQGRDLRNSRSNYD